MDRATLTVGVVTPHAAPGPEVELPEMATGRVTAVMARVRAAGAGVASTPPSGTLALRALAEPSALEGAAAAFRDGSVDVVAHASTSSGYALGLADEAVMVERLARYCGVPVVASGSSAIAALRALGSRRVALVHPAWFDDEVHAWGSSYFNDQGFAVSLFKAGELPLDPALVRIEHVVDWVVRHVGDQHDVIFLGGNGLRAAGAIDELERRCGVPVLESNQVLLWSILAATHTSWDVTGYGRLFQTPRDATPTTTTGGSP